MIDLLTKVLDAGGIAALAITALSLVFVHTVKVLWTHNQRLHIERDKLQEKRVAEMQSLAERVIHGQHETTTELRRLTDSFDTFIRLQGGS